MPGMLIKPVAYEEFHAALELKILSRAFLVEPNPIPVESKE